MTVVFEIMGNKMERDADQFTENMLEAAKACVRDGRDWQEWLDEIEFKLIEVKEG